MRRVLIALLTALILSGLGTLASGGQPAWAGSVPPTKVKADPPPGVSQPVNLSTGGADQALAAKFAKVCPKYPTKYAICQGVSTVGVPAAVAPVVGCPSSTGAVGMPYSSAITATGGTPPYVLYQAAPLPPGLNLNPSTGAITGTPATMGSYAFTVSAVDSAGLPGSASCSITIAGPSIQPPSLCTPTDCSFTVVGFPPFTPIDILISTGPNGPFPTPIPFASATTDANGTVHIQLILGGLCGQGFGPFTITVTTTSGTPTTATVTVNC